MAHSKQDELLATKMHQLMDVPTFNRWFVQYKYTGVYARSAQNEIINEATIPTLAEFLSKNNHPVEHHKTLWCGKERKGFARQSTSFQKLRDFLLREGFSEHWIVRSEKAQLRLFPMSALKHRDIRDLPFAYVCNVKMDANTYEKLLELFPGTKGVELTVAQVLTINEESVETLTGRRSEWLIDYGQVQALRAFILLSQKKLRNAGLRDEDGAFMLISFTKKKEIVEIGSYRKKKRKQGRRYAYGNSLRLTIKNFYRYAAVK